MRLIGFDPGLRATGWGVVDVDGARLRHVANGIATTDETRPTAERLAQLHDQLSEVIQKYAPEAAAIEETFVNRNAVSTLKLGDRKSTRLNSSHIQKSRMPSSA